MDAVSSAALASWNLNPGVIALLVLIAFIYIRGFRGGADDRFLSSAIPFLAGLAVVFLATESPLDAFDGLFLSAHMAQHLLLMMVAPPLILLGDPLLPLLRGMPRAFVKEGLGPFLTWGMLKRGFNWLTSPVIAWVIFSVSTVFWHLPRFYELALRSPVWHGLQHASFFWTGILFWWPIVRPGPGRSRWPLWTGIPYLLFADLVNTALSAFFIFSGRVLYPAYAAVRLTGLGALEDQKLAGAIMWVPGSLIYLVPAVILAMKVVSGNSTNRAATARKRSLSRNRAATAKERWFSLRLRRFRRPAQIMMLLIAIAVMADGFFGPPVAPINLAGVLPWIHWRALAVFAILIVGNLFCMSCPFTLVRDIGRKVLPAKLRWPRVLRNKWLPIGLLILYFWAYEAFSLWDRPWVTAAIILGYFLTALVIDGVFRGASFCKFVCPIGQFHFVSSLVSPREIRVRKHEVCHSCTTYDCIRGNQRARGCELYLFQPKKESNLDCTFCLDCVKACPHDNVGLVSVAPASTLTTDPYRSSLGRLSARTDMAALALLIVFAAFVNAAGMITPVMNWEHGWHARLGAQAMPLIIAAFVLCGAILLPSSAVGICAWINRMFGDASDLAATARRYIYALVPVGISMWAAHLLYHFVTSSATVVPAIERVTTGSARTMVFAYMPDWLTPLQLLILDAGLLLAIYLCWRIGKQIVVCSRSALVLSAPWAGLACVLYAAGVWILFEPMQMRGMMH